MRRIALLLSAGMLVLAFAGTAQAETLVVTTTTDAVANPPVGSCLPAPVGCSLREAVTDANDNTETPGADIIRLPPGTYTLTNDALPLIPGEVAVESTGGAAVTTITGATTNVGAPVAAGGAFSVSSTGKLTIRGVTISGNTLVGGPEIGAGAIGLGGGELVVESSVLRDNRVQSTGDSSGGAIAGEGGSGTVRDSAIEGNVNASTGSLTAAGGISWDLPSGAGVTITRSSISRNRIDPASGTNTSAGGGLFVSAGNSLTVTDSTVSQNTVPTATASFRGGGIFSNQVSSTTLTNVTVTENAGGTPSGLSGGNLYLPTGASSAKVVSNSIVSEGVGGNCLSVGAPITSSGGNIEDANSCNFTGPGDQITTDPRLGALTINGGLGLSRLPLSSSPAYGLARPAFCSASDQRGVARPQGGACDSGAVESATPPVNTTPPSISGTAAAGQTLTCNPGAFTQAPTLAFQWLSDGAAIAGATASTFALTDAQLDTAVQCQVTATNIAAQTVATSAAVVPPRPAVVSPPVNTARPSITGALRTGKQLTCSPGTFTGATSFAFAWLRNGAAIPGATAATYTLAQADADKAIQCSVTATGPGGSVVAESAPGAAAEACIVPKLVGKKLTKATKALESANCAVGKTKKRKSSKKPGTVLSSSPAKGENLPAGTKVALTVATS